MDNLLTHYNYDSFTPANFEQWMNFENSPKTGLTAPDFPVWDLDQIATRLSVVWSQHDFTVVEFGSFT